MRSLARLTVVLLAAVTACSEDSSPPPEGPLYGGEPCSVWLERIEDLHWKTREEASQALIEFGGAEVAAALVARLDNERREVVADIVQTLYHLDEIEPVIVGLRSPSPRIRAWSAIAHLGILVEMRYRPHTSLFGGVDDLAAGPMPGFSGWLEHEDVFVRLAAAMAHRETAGEMLRRTQVLRGVVVDPDVDQRYRVLSAQALREDGVRVDGVVASLVGQAQCEDSADADNAAVLLGELGPAALGAVSALERIARDHETEYVRDTARDAIERIRHPERATDDDG